MINHDSGFASFTNLFFFMATDFLAHLFYDDNWLSVIIWDIKYILSLFTYHWEYNLTAVPGAFLQIQTGVSVSDGNVFPASVHVSLFYWSNLIEQFKEQ